VFKPDELNSLYIDNPEGEFNIKSFPEKGVDLKTIIANVEKALIDKAMDVSGGVKTRAAEILGLSFREFRYRYAKYYKEKEEVSDKI